MKSNPSIPHDVIYMQDGGGGKYSILQMSSEGDGYASTDLRYRLYENKHTYWWRSASLGSVIDV